MNIQIEGENGSYQVGGIAGLGISATINSCTNEGSIKGPYGAGGICSRSGGSKYKECYNKGSITSYTWVGGICGLDESGNAEFLGEEDATIFGEYYNCKNEGELLCTGENGQKGDIVGAKNTPSHVKIINEE